jgi:hypothetical protein
MANPVLKSLHETCGHDLFAVVVAGQRVLICVRCHFNLNTGKVIENDTWDSMIQPLIEKRAFEIYLKKEHHEPGRGFCIRCKAPTRAWRYCEECFSEIGGDR